MSFLDELEPSESLALSAGECAERAVSAAPKSTKGVEASRLVRSKNSPWRTRTGAIRDSRIACKDGFRNTS